MVATPENTYSSSDTVFLDISPHANLTSGALVSTAGTGFTPNVQGAFRECTLVGETRYCSVERGNFVTNGDGAFGAFINVFRAFTPFPPAPNAPTTVDCLVSSCFLLAKANIGESYAGHRLHFFNEPPPVVSPVTGLNASIPLDTGQRAAALRRCLKVKNRAKRRICQKKARLLPV